MDQEVIVLTITTPELIVPTKYYHHPTNSSPGSSCDRHSKPKIQIQKKICPGD